MSICAIIPAHNEEQHIADAICGLQAQTLQPSRIIVAADNCTDDTAPIARAAGAEVFETVGNTGKKAGALNQAIRWLDGDYDFLLVTDADTVIANTWIEDAYATLRAEPSVGAVGAIFTADTDDTWLTRCQAMEWGRLAEELHATGRTMVLTGTATLLRREAIRDVAHHGPYREDVITEDFAISLDLLAAGWQLRSPDSCRCVTDTMKTVRDLLVQRRRWYGGALQTLSRHGVRSYTLRYLRQQTLLTVGIIAFVACWALAAWSAAAGTLAMSPLWVTVGVIFWIERVYTAPAHKLFAALLLPELAYAILLQVAYMMGVWTQVTKREMSW